MKLEALVNQQTRSIELDKKAEGTFHVSLDGGSAIPIDIRRVEPDVWSLIINGRSHEVTIQNLNGLMRVSLSGASWDIEVYDPRRQPAHAVSKRVVEGEQVISSPMPGRVVGIAVNEGDKVTAGQGVIIIEAMKMENELTAEGDGTVREIKVKIGDAVEDGQALVVIE